MSSLCVDRYDDHVPSATTTRIARALFATSDNVLLTILRVTLGLVILPHGLQKTFGLFGGYGFSGTLNGFASIGIPAVLGFLAIFAESAGAIALITGFTTRIAAFGIGVTLTVAAFMHRANGFFMNWSGQQKGEGFEFHILVVAIALVLMIGGAGRFSLDRAVAKGTAQRPE